MRFGDMLFLFIEIADTPISDLAAYLEYDRSYLSKWIHNKELPPEKKWDRILDSLVEFFEDKIDEFDMYLLLSQLPRLRKVYGKDLDNFNLKAIFENAYMRSLDLAEIENNKTIEEVLLYIKGKDNFRDYLMDAIFLDIRKSRGRVNLFYNDNILDLFTSQDIELSYTQAYLPEATKISFESKVFTNTNLDIGLRIGYMEKYLKFLTYKPYADLELYEDRDKPLDFINFTDLDSFYGWGVKDGDSLEDIFISSNKSVIDDNISIIKETFSPSKRVFHLVDQMEDLYAYTEALDPKSSPITFLPSLYLYFADIKLMTIMAKERDFSEGEEALWNSIYKIINSDKSKDNRFYICKSALDLFDRYSIIHTSKGIIKLSEIHKQIYKFYIDKFIQRENVSLIDDDSKRPRVFYPQQAIYCNEEGVLLFKETTSQSNGFKDILYTSTNKDFSNLMYKYLDRLVVS